MVSSTRKLIVSAFVVVAPRPCRVRKFDAEVETGVEAERLEPFAEPGECVAHLTGA